MRLCLNSLQFGIGNVNRTTTCTLELKIKTNNERAMQVCKAVSPYNLLRVMKGYPTKCVYDKTFYCEDFEEEFLGYCFVVRGRNKQYSKRVCGKKYKLHVIRNSEEIKWVSTFFGALHEEVWVGNVGNTVKHLKPIQAKRPKFNDKISPKKAPIKLRLSKGGLDGIKVGTAIYGDKRELIGHLCSREASLYYETMQEEEIEQGTIFEKLKLPHQFVTEKDGYKRTYMYVGTVHAVEGNEFEANVTDLNKFCDNSERYCISSLRQYQYEYLQGEIQASETNQMQTPAKEMPEMTTVILKMTNLRLHASGVFSNVYRGTVLEPKPQREIAIKKTWPESKDRERNFEMIFLTGISRKKHKNIVQMIFAFSNRVGKDNKICESFVFDFLPDTLASVIKREVLDDTDIKIYTWQLFNGLRYLSMHQIVHRDIKPLNVLIDHPLALLKIGDFGSAKIVRSYNKPVGLRTPMRAPHAHAYAYD
nr:Serine threonine protein kinase-related domain containing protein [Haemonchus contortus]